MCYMYGEAARGEWWCTNNSVQSHISCRLFGEVGGQPLPCVQVPPQWGQPAEHLPGTRNSLLVNFYIINVTIWTQTSSFIYSKVYKHMLLELDACG
jgi:hypothetical protein